MNGTPPVRITGRLIAGSVLILLGLLFTLDHLGFLEAGDLFDYWPLVLIAIGLVRVLQPQGEGRRAFGFVLIGVGLVFQLEQLGFISFDLWPFALVVIGGILVWRALRGTAPGADRPVASSSLQSDFAFMGGVHRVVETPDFRGGSATAIMGAVELDLRGAKIATSPAVLDVFALWGGVEITVPPDWKVDVQVVPILGGVENKARSVASAAGEPEQVLVFRGTVLMGGAEIKN